MEFSQFLIAFYARLSQNMTQEQLYNEMEIEHINRFGHRQCKNYGVFRAQKSRYFRFNERF